MEKQRIKSIPESGRRLLILIVLFLFCGAVDFSLLWGQTLTSTMINNLRIEPVENQQLVTNTEIKFMVEVPFTSPGQIDISMPEEQENVIFRTLRKVDSGTSTKIEMWYSFTKPGTYVLSPLVVKIKSSRRQIRFSPVAIEMNLKEQQPVCVILFDGKQKNEITVTAGKPVNFRINIQYASQLVLFNWDIPKDSIFTQKKAYEITEVKQREKVLTQELIPVSDFTWTPLVTGDVSFPSFSMTAVSYAGQKVNVKIPEIKVHVVSGNNRKNKTGTDYFVQAFDEVFEETVAAENIVITLQQCQTLASLRSRERHSIFGDAVAQRTEFEKNLNLPFNQKEYPVIFIYIFAFLFIVSGIFFIIFIKFRRPFLSMGLGLIFILTLVLFIYSVVVGSKEYAVSTGTELYSIPEASAGVKSELPPGNRVQILSKSEDWIQIRFGETEAWCNSDKLIFIK